MRGRSRVKEWRLFDWLFVFKRGENVSPLSFIYFEYKVCTRLCCFGIMPAANTHNDFECISQYPCVVLLMSRLRPRAGVRGGTAKGGGLLGSRGTGMSRMLYTKPCPPNTIIIERSWREGGKRIEERYGECGSSVGCCGGGKAREVRAIFGFGCKGFPARHAG